MGKHKNDIPRLLAMCRFYRDNVMTPDTYIRYLATKKKILANALEFSKKHNTASVLSRVSAYRHVCGTLFGAMRMREIMRGQ